MDNAASIERRLSAMGAFYRAGIRTTCFISPIFPGITDVEAIIRRVKKQCSLIWLENLNLRGSCKTVMMQYIQDARPHLLPLYREIHSVGIVMNHRAEMIAAILAVFLCPQIKQKTF